MSGFNQEIEKLIAKATIKALLAANLRVSVDDGDDVVLKHSCDPGAIFGAMFSTDTDLLEAHHPDGTAYGWVRFIYGNSGYDVINDYHLHLEEVLKPVELMIDRLEAGDFSAMWPVPLLDRKVTGHYGETVCTVGEFFADNAEAFNFNAAEVIRALREIEESGRTEIAIHAGVATLRVVEG